MLVAHAGGATAAGGDLFAGIEAAIAAGVGAVELDVRRSADDVLVVYHGAPPGEVSLQGAPQDVAGVPALDEVLEHVARRVGVNLELKEAGYERQVLELALAHVAPEYLLITSFLDTALLALRAAHPDVATGLLVGARPSRRRPAAAWQDVFPFGRLDVCGADVLCPHSNLDFVAMRGRAARRGVPLLLWTVNDVPALRAALDDERLLGVVSDRLGA